MATRHCDAETLRALALGTLASAEAAQARLHLGECRECAQALADLDPLGGETLAHGPRQPTTGEVFLQAQARTLERGTRVDRYVILERLGSGGMGEIYAAYDPELDRKIALKLMRMDVLSTMGTVSGRARLLAEAKALARLNHPNVVAVHDVGEVGDEIFIAMELVEGEVLRDWLEAAPRSVAQVLEVFKMAGRGLAAAHEVGLVHRDFKPLNVIVGRDGRVRVVDFGLARTASVADTVAGRPRVAAPAALPAGADTPVIPQVESTQAALSGTPPYMSPEQLRAEATDARTDQFSFAVALFEALAGQRPFPADTVDELLAAMERGPGPARSMPGWIHAVLARALSARREGRFPSMGAMLEALERDPSRRRRQRWRMAGVALAAVAVVLGAAAARTSAQRRCAPPRSRWDGLWDAQRKVSLRQAFARTDRPFAAAASDAVDRALDRYRADWLSMHQQACLATLDGAQALDVLNLRTECLDRRLSGIRALVDQLLKADEAAVRNAARAMDDLPPLADCADEKALRTGAAWPLEPSRRAEVEAARGQVARARALFAVGSLNEATEEISKAAAAAEASGYKPLVAEAELLAAQIHALRYEFLEAVAAEHRAAAAATATGQLELLAPAWILLIRHSAVAGQDAAVWSAYAEALLGRLSGDTRGLRVALLKAQGVLEVQQRRYARGLELARQALALAEPTFGKDHTLTREALDTIANSSWYLGDLDTALAAYERAREIDRRTRGPDHPGFADHLRDEAGILVERGDWEEALRRATAAEAVYARTVHPNSGPMVTARYHRALAMAHLEAERGASPGAEALARETLQRLERDHPGEAAVTVNATVTLAHVLRILGRCREALPLLERAVGLLAPDATVAADQWDLQDANEHLGACLLATGAPARARAPLEQSVKWFTENGSRNFLLGEGQFLLAQARWQTGAKAEALADAEAARALLESVGPRGRKLVPQVDRWLAERRR